VVNIKADSDLEVIGNKFHYEYSIKVENTSAVELCLDEMAPGGC
jgi:hypothetical protein